MKQLYKKNAMYTSKLLNFSKILIVIVIILSSSITTASASVIDEETVSQESSGIFESILSKTILGFVNTLINITGAQDVSVLVFQEPSMQLNSLFQNTMTSDKNQLVYGIFPPEFYRGIEIFYNAFNNAIPMPIMVLIAFGGLVLLLDVFKNSGRRNSAKEYLLGAIFAIMAMNFGHYLWQLVTGLNDILVSGLYNVLRSQGITVTSFTTTIWDSGSGNVFNAKNLVVALLVLFACITTFTLNYQYMMRMITLGFLIIIFPIVVVLLVLPSKRSAIGQWLQLFTSNVFLQFGHALVLSLFFYFLHVARGFDFWLVLVMFFALPAMTDLVNRFVGMIFGDGFGGGMGTTMKNMSGMGSVMSMMALSRNMFGKNNSNINSNSSKQMIDNGMAQTAITNAHNQPTNSTMPIGNSLKDQSSTPTNSTGSVNQTSNDTTNQSNNSIGTSNSTSTNNTNAHSENKNQNLVGGINTNNQSTSSNGNSTSATGSSPYSAPNVLSPNKVAAQVENAQSAIPTTKNRPSNSELMLNDSLLNKANTPNTPNKPSTMENLGSSALMTTASIGKGIATGSSKVRDLANNDKFRKVGKMAAIATFAGAGAALSTMATGKGGTGMAAGAVVGYGTGKLGAKAIDKGTRATQVGGEVLQSKAEGRGALDITKDRVGYKAQAQLANKDEMARMGQELVGGKTGSITGKIASDVTRMGAGRGVNFGGVNTTNAVNRESKRERLEQEHLPKITNRIEQQRQKVQGAETHLREAIQQRQVQNTPQNKQAVLVAHQTVQNEKQTLSTLEGQKQQMEGQLQNFYQLEQIRNEASKIKSPTGNSNSEQKAL